MVIRYDKNRSDRPQVRKKKDILKQWIDNSPLSKRDIAELLRVTKRTINRWLKGTRSPRANDQKRLIDLTGLAFWELFEEK